MATSTVEPNDTASQAVLIEAADTVVTFDDDDRVLNGADVLVVGDRIEALGPSLDVDQLLPVGAELQRVPGDGLLVLPGLVNGHQHIVQVGFRALQGLETAEMGPWLGGLGQRILARAEAGNFGPDAVGALALAGFAESVLGGVTTVAEQHYNWPGGHTAAGPLAEAIIEAADAMGLRLNFGRGCITLPAEAGGTTPEVFVERLDDVVAHSQSLIERYHQPGSSSRLRIDLAPCGVHVDLPETFAVLAELAAEHESVGLHTHLYEEIDTNFAVAHYGVTAWDILVDNGWAQPRAWLAHMNDPPLEQIPEFAQAGVGVIHLIAPDLRLGWGLAPLRDYLNAGCRVGFGTTGSASNDGANVMGDLRLAALAHRMDPDRTRWPTAHELLRLATRGSADAIGRPELGRLAPGCVADIAAWDLHAVDRVGIDDPVAGLVLSGLSDRAALVMVGGRTVVRDGSLTHLHEATIAAAARAVCWP